MLELESKDIPKETYKLLLEADKINNPEEREDAISFILLRFLSECLKDCFRDL